MRPFSIVATKVTTNCEAKGLLPEEQCEFHPPHSTTKMVLALRRLQKLGRKARVPLFPCFINLKKVYRPVDCALLWPVLARFGVPPQRIEVIRHFHDGMRAYVWNDDGVWSEWFEVARERRQGCVLFIAAVQRFLR